MRRVTTACAAAAFVLGAVSAHAQTWNIQIVDDAGLTGYESRIAITSDDTPYLFYMATGYWAWMAKWVPSGDGGGWDKWPLGYTVPYYLRCGFVAGPGDSLHLATSRSSPNRIDYNIYNANTQLWDVSGEMVTDEYGGISMVLIDSAGVVIPTIVYATYLTPHHVQFARRDPGTGIWAVQMVDDTDNPQNPAIAVDSAYHAHVCFYEAVGDNLMYATNAGGTWVSEYLDITGNVGQYCAIAIDAGDVPYIVYYDVTNGDLKYARMVVP
jgi:hypothetical protein